MTPSLRLTRLTLTDFRNYAGLRLAAEASAVVLTGPNGAGKTNLIEAISLLAPGRGLRGASFDMLVRQEGAWRWAVAGDLARPDGLLALGTSWGVEAQSEEVNGQSRQVVIDGVAQRSSGALGAHTRLLWLTPAMDRLFSGPPSERRRFLDRLVAVFDPEHGARILSFEKLMRDRNLLLEDLNPDAKWLSSLEAQMAEAGAAIAAARLAAISALEGHIASHAQDGAFPHALLEVAGSLEAALAVKPAVQAEADYRKLLRDSRGADRAAGRTLKGPHRSDFLVTHGVKAIPANLCSTGEQKALLIGLILAQARAVSEAVGLAPILLLDEIAAHLDEERREGLFAALKLLSAQAWMTGTDEHLFASLDDADRFHVESAHVTRH